MNIVKTPSKGLTLVGAFVFGLSLLSSTAYAGGPQIEQSAFIKRSVAASSILPIGFTPGQYLANHPHLADRYLKEQTRNGLTVEQHYTDGQLMDSEWLGRRDNWLCALARVSFVTEKERGLAWLPGVPASFDFNVYRKINMGLDGRYIREQLNLTAKARQEGRDLSQGQYLLKTDLSPDQTTLVSVQWKGKRAEWLQRQLLASFQNKEPVLAWMAGFPEGFDLQKEYTSLSEDALSGLAFEAGVELDTSPTPLQRGKLIEAFQLNLKAQPEKKTPQTEPPIEDWDAFLDEKNWSKVRVEQIKTQVQDMKQKWDDLRVNPDTIALSRLYNILSADLLGTAQTLEYLIFIREGQELGKNAEKYFLVQLRDYLQKIKDTETRIQIGEADILFAKYRVDDTLQEGVEVVPLLEGHRSNNNEETPNHIHQAFLEDRMEQDRRAIVVNFRGAETSFHIYKTLASGDCGLVTLNTDRQLALRLVQAVKATELPDEVFMNQYFLEDAIEKLSIPYEPLSAMTLTILGYLQEVNVHVWQPHETSYQRVNGDLELWNLPGKPDLHVYFDAEGHYERLIPTEDLPACVQAREREDHLTNVVQPYFEKYFAEEGHEERLAELTRQLFLQ